jgi:putative acetyltransferase
MATETLSAPRENTSARVPVNAPGNAPGATIGTSGGVTLRLACDDDAEAIIKLISAVWSEYPGKTLVAAADMPELLHPAASYAKCDGRFWVVEAHGRIIGTIALQPSAEPGVVELQKLYVAREMRRNGLGGFLCHLVEREAHRRGAHAIELWSDIKLLDAHRRYERLGYRRGETLKSYNDTSGTVRYYYRKAIDILDTTISGDGERADGQSMSSGPRWEALLARAGDRDPQTDGTNIRRLSFTAHPASVGENYFQHLGRAAGFAINMIGGGLGCLVHALLPFLFVHTGSSVIADLNSRMITNRRRQSTPPSTAQTSAKRISAA